jgi:inhibitor of the pro-sigma K processing machinery
MDYGVIAIVGICLLILVIGILKQKAQLVLYFCARIALGMAGVYFLNNFLKSQEVSALVGMNPVSALTIGFLGISGFALLYGILFYQML